MFMLIPATRSGSRSRRGFTIVELLVVIVVIGILATITVVAYNGTQARARDATRIDRLTTIAQALDMYYGDNGRYPPIQDGATAESTCGSQTENWGHCDRAKELADDLAPYMAIDPVSLSSATQGSYSYYYTGFGFDNYQHYGLLVYLEGSGGQNDGGSVSNAYEVGSLPAYCASQYTGANASWRWTSRSTLCAGGN